MGVYRSHAAKQEGNAVDEEDEVDREEETSRRRKRKTKESKSLFVRTERIDRSVLCSPHPPSWQGLCAVRLSRSEKSMRGAELLGTRP
jgi:hypothetical protein